MIRSGWEMVNINYPSFASRFVGYLAMEALGKGDSFSVMGATSQGIFLRSGTRILFISFGPFCSPFTITLQGKPIGLVGIQPGMTVSVNHYRIDIPGFVTITYDPADEWKPARFPQKMIRLQEMNHRLRRISMRVLKEDKDIGFGVLLGPLLDLNKYVPLKPDMLPVFDRLLKVKTALLGVDIDQCVSLLNPLLGMGRGLTPSGDDLIAGLLLTFRRGGNSIFPPDALISLGRFLVDNAYQRTTTLSANIIEAAAAGQADERQVAVIDTILAGRRGIRQQLAHLLHMGHSSGIDALVGMTIALTYHLPP